MQRQNAQPPLTIARIPRFTQRLAFIALAPAILAAWPASPANFSPLIPASRQRTDAAATPETELHLGISLTQQGHFSEAIPHFLRARGHVADEFAANFNLALCYVATEKFENAIAVLNSLKTGTNTPPAVNNLLAQAYVGLGRYSEADDSFQQAVKQTPDDEKLYLFIADACLDRAAYDFGLQVLNAGLLNLPRSSRLHYQRGVFLSFENDPDAAIEDFDLARKFDPQSDIAYMAAGQEALLEGNVPEAIRATRAGIKKGRTNYILLTIFADAVLRSGARPGAPEFSEAESALKQSVAQKPNYADAHALLGELYLTTGQLDLAISELETARMLDPRNPSVCSHLAMAYRRKGDLASAEKMLENLAALNRQQSEKYKTGAPGRRAGYISSGRLPH